MVREAHAVLPTTRSEAVAASGRARISSTGPWGTELVVPGTELVVRIDSLPDADRADTVRRSVDRIVWQQIDPSPAGTSAEVFAVAHRRPLRLRIGASAALGLLERGVPTVVRLDAQP